jgi:hypothetical protein
MNSAASVPLSSRSIISSSSESDGSNEEGFRPGSPGIFDGYDQEVHRRQTKKLRREVHTLKAQV